MTGWFKIESVRRLALVLAGCGGAATPAPVGPATLPASKPLDMGSNLDPFAALAEAPAEPSWLLPGRARLDDGGATFEATKAPLPIPVRVVERHGTTIRAAVQLEQLR